MAQPKTIAIQLGRFSPYHKGHQMVTAAMIAKYGITNCVVLIGSSNVLNARTPYTYAQRQHMINSVYPELKVLPLPDVNPELIQFEDKTLDKWLDQISQLEVQLNAKFQFCGGSEADINYLSPRFATEVIVNRSAEGQGISATQVRELIKAGNTAALQNLLPQPVINLALNY